MERARFRVPIGEPLNGSDGGGNGSIGSIDPWKKKGFQKWGKGLCILVLTFVTVGLKPRDVFFFLPSLLYAVSGGLSCHWIWWPDYSN